MDIADDDLLIKKCKNLILNKFRLYDLDYCLGKLDYKISGTKKKLQNKLLCIFDKNKNNKNFLKLILERGYVLDCYLKTGLEIYDTEVISKLYIESDYNYLNHKNNINMRKLYFYKNIQKIAGWSIVEIRNIDRYVSVNFKLSYNSFKSLYIETDVGKSPQTVYLLRCTKINYDGDDEISSFKDEYPVGMKLLINGDDFSNLLPREIYYTQQERRERLSIPTILNDGILKNQKTCKLKDSIKIEVKIKKDGNKYDLYAFGIFSSTQRSVQDLCNEILHRKKKSIDKFKEDFKSFMLKSKDIKLDCVKVYLRSSITLKRIKIPFRGKNCNHIIPDDLEDYIKNNKNNEKWLCKICESSCTPDDIIIDEFYEKILEKHQYIDEILLLSGMKYKLTDESSDTFDIKDLLKKDDSKDDIEVIVIDSDDEVTVISGKSSTLRTSTFKNSLKNRVKYRKNLRRSPRFIRGF